MCPRAAESAAGVILTGGDSRRMGRDKATLPIAGVPMAARIARALAAALDPGGVPPPETSTKS